MTTVQAQANALDSKVSSVPQPGIVYPLLSTAAGAAVTLTANLGDNVSGIVGVTNFRRVALWIMADVGAATGVAQIVPLFSAELNQPALGDDSWFGLGVQDATVTPTLLTGTLPAGADYTIAPEWAAAKYRPLVIRTEDGDANTDKIRMIVPLDVSHARWMYVAAKQTTAAMNLLIKWSVCL